MKLQFEDHYNENHNPPLDIEKLHMQPGWILVHRPARPEEHMLEGGIIRPEQVDHVWEPNCAVIVKCGEECKSQVGDYAVWYSLDKEKQPFPFTPFHSDKMPGYFGIREDWLMAIIKA